MAEQVVKPEAQEPPKPAADPVVEPVKPAAEDKPAPVKAVDGKEPEPKVEPERKAADPEPAKVPEKYDLKVPEGADVFFEAVDLAAFERMAKANELTQEEAQIMVEQEAEARHQLVIALGEQTKNDPDYGGAKLSESQQLARRAIERVRPAGHPRADAFNKLLTKTGYGNHIEVVAFMADLGRLMAEDQPGGSKIPEGKLSREELFYGKKS